MSDPTFRIHSRSIRYESNSSRTKHVERQAHSSRHCLPALRLAPGRPAGCVRARLAREPVARRQGHARARAVAFTHSLASTRRHERPRQSSALAAATRTASATGTLDLAHLRSFTHAAFVRTRTPRTLTGSAISAKVGNASSTLDALPARHHPRTHFLAATTTSKHGGTNAPLRDRQFFQSTQRKSSGVRDPQDRRRASPPSIERQPAAPCQC